MTEQQYLTAVGKNISKIRIQKGLRQVDVADICDMEDTNIIRIEKGRTNPTSLTLFKIAKALNVDIREFFEFDA